MATNENALAQLEGDSGRLDIGFKGSESPRVIPMGATQDMDHLRFEGGAIRKDFGWTTLGDASPSKILALGEHGAFTPSGVQGEIGTYQYFLYRIYLEGLTPVIQTFNQDSGGWIERVRLTERGMFGNWNIINAVAGPPLSGDATFLDDEVTLLIHETDARGDDRALDLATIAVGASLNIQGATWTVDAIVDSGAFYTLTLSPGAQRPATYLNPAQIVLSDAAEVDFEIGVVTAATDFLSTVSIQDVLAVANGLDPIMVWQTVPLFTEDIIAYAGNPLATVGDNESVAVVSGSSGSIQYTVSYSAELLSFSGGVTSVKLTTAVDVDGVEVKTDVQSFSATELRSNLTISFQDAIEAGINVTIRIKALEADAITPTVEELTTELSGSGSFSDRTFTTDSITVPFTVSGDILNVFFHPIRDDSLGPSDPYSVEILVEDNAAPVVIATFGPFDINDPGPQGRSINISSFGFLFTANPVTFQIRIFSSTAPNEDTLELVNVFSDTNRFEFVAGAFALNVIGNELRYSFESGVDDIFHKINPSNFPETVVGFGPNAPTPAPNAKYVASFADRLFGLWDEGDRQQLNASADGNVLMWTRSQVGFPALFQPDDSVNLSLIDNRVDPIDDLNWLHPVSSQIAILGRQRSLMRVFETGNNLLAVGATHWQDGIGTETPYGACQVEGGVMFMGHNRMVYYMTADQVIPVGRDIQEELIKHFIPFERDEWEDSQCMYDTAFQEWYIGVPWNGERNIQRWFIFDLGHYIRTREMRWRRRSVPCSRMTVVHELLRDNLTGSGAGVSARGTVSPEDLPEGPPRPIAPKTSGGIPKERSLVFSDPGLNVQYINEVSDQIAGLNYVGSWESPTLSRGSMGEEATLRTIGLQYAASEDTFVDIDVSGDGGQNYTETKRLILLSTKKQVRRIRVGVNTTGYDLRFRIRFTDTQDEVKIFSYYPSIVTRGRTVL